MEEDSDDSGSPSAAYKGRTGDSHGASSGGGAQALQKRDKSLKLEAQFLRTLACRTGVLGGISARSDPVASVPGDTMDVDDDEEGDVDRGKGKGPSAPGRVAGAAVPGHVMQRLESLAIRLVEKYALLSDSDRGLACRGLCQLWLALAGCGQGDNLSRAVRLKVESEG